VNKKQKPSKREAILDAMLDVVVERGFHDAPMSLIAKRSGASAGVIYHYFPSKEAIIQALYERVREMKRASLLEGCSPEMEPREALFHIWRNAYHFYRKHMRELQFLDQYENAPFACSPESRKKDHDREQTEYERQFRSKSKGGLLNELPPEVIYELTLGLAARLAKQPRKLSDATLRNIAETVWKAIRAEKN
jgi:TetR/AcrR family transcriptional regulator, repressor of fatR-cypB operon